MGSTFHFLLVELRQVRTGMTTTPRSSGCCSFRLASLYVMNDRVDEASRSAQCPRRGLEECMQSVGGASLLLRAHRFSQPHWVAVIISHQPATRLARPAPSPSAQHAAREPAALAADVPQHAASGSTTVSEHVVRASCNTRSTCRRAALHDTHMQTPTCGSLPPAYADLYAT